MELDTHFPTFKQLLKKILRTLRYIYRDFDIHQVPYHIHQNTGLNISYISLLSISIIISTLGLLVNNQPIIIGGMIISPLMWPLMHISYSISRNNHKELKQTLFLLIFSITVGVLVSISITFLSPIKSLTEEIIARTTPTFIDLLIALCAGMVASLALTNPKISNSLAGVAIATSLVPPLSVIGIGMALGSLEITYNSALLFITNVISIVFISLITFIFLDYIDDKKTKVNTQGFNLVLVGLVLTSIPLIAMLRTYAFQLNTYQKVTKILTTNISQISPEIIINNIQTKVQKSSKGRIVKIHSDLYLPSNIEFTFEHKNFLISKIQEQLNINIILNLQIQNLRNISSEQDIHNNIIKQKLNSEIHNYLKKISPTLTIDKLDIFHDQKNNHWKIYLTAFDDPQSNINQQQLLDFETHLSQFINETIVLTINIIPRLQIKSESDILTDSIKSKITEYLKSYNSGIIVLDINSNQQNNNSSQPFQLDLILTIPQDITISTSQINNLEEEIYKLTQTNYKINLKTISLSTQ